MKIALIREEPRNHGNNLDTTCFSAAKKEKGTEKDPFVLFQLSTFLTVIIHFYLLLMQCTKKLKKS